VCIFTSIARRVDVVIKLPCIDEYTIVLIVIVETAIELTCNESPFIDENTRELTPIFDAFIVLPSNVE
jgi:hypothetical protein